MRLTFRCPEDEGDAFLRNVGKIPTRLNGFKTQETIIHTVCTNPKLFIKMDLWSKIGESNIFNNF
jgi:hypothetical protein